MDNIEVTEEKKETRGRKKKEFERDLVLAYGISQLKNPATQKYEDKEIYFLVSKRWANSIMKIEKSKRPELWAHVDSLNDVYVGETAKEALIRIKKDKK